MPPSETDDRDALFASGDVGQPSRQDAVGDEIAVELADSLPPEEALAAPQGVNAFGFDLHRAVAEPGENTVTSPLSASALLAIVAAGAGGPTAVEMVEEFGLEDTRARRHAALPADLTGESDMTLSIANSLLAAESDPFEDGGVAFVQEGVWATLDDVDLGAQQTADRIDGWDRRRAQWWRLHDDVTGGAMTTSAGPPPLLVRRPFAFTVSDHQISTILFLGTVHDPRS